MEDCVPDEDDLLPLSGLAHMAHCERRWALVHVEQQWAENRFTVEGADAHERAHSGAMESRPGVLVRRTLPLRSFHLGLSGQADVVEFERSDASGSIALNGRRGRWRVFPIEYKRSRDKAGSIAYRLQLCAQAMCLEEMLGAEIHEGAVYDASTRRRQPVQFAPAVRREVERLAGRMRELFVARFTPPARLMPACRSCSLREICLPSLLSVQPDAAAYLHRMRRSEL